MPITLDTDDPPAALAQLLAELDFPDSTIRMRPGRWELDPVRQPIPAWLRRAVLERDGHRCSWCGRGGELQVDHLRPRCAGGGNASWNLRALCPPCNRRRSNRLTDYLTVGRVLPVAAACSRCGTPELTDGLVPAFCAACGMGGTAEWSWCA